MRSDRLSIQGVSFLIQWALVKRFFCGYHFFVSRKIVSFFITYRYSSFKFCFTFLDDTVRDILEHVIAGEDVSDFSDLSGSDDEEWNPPASEMMKK